ncbi:MAG: O-antigen/teichoic acid export membrane protein [Rhodothermales bacterium]
MSRLRKLGSETAIYGVSSILGRAVNFLLFPFYTQVLSPEEYGPVTVVYAAFVFLNILYQYGMESAYLKFASATDANRPRVFSSAMWSLMGTAALFSTALWVFKGQAAFVIGLSGDHELLLGFAAAILFLDTASVVPFAELRLSNRPIYFAVVRFSSVLVNVSANLLLILGAGMGVEGILLANVASSAVSFVLLFPVVRQNITRDLDRGLWKQMLRFGLPFLPGGLGYAISERVNIFFLSRLPAETVVDLYGASMPPETLATIQGGDAAAASEYVLGAFGILKLAVLAALGVQMFRYAWQPFFLNHAKDEDAPQLFGRIFLILTAALFGVVLGVSFFAAELVAIPLPGGRTLIEPTYWVGLSILPPALLGYAFQGWYYHFSAGAYIQKKTVYFVQSTLAGSVVALAVNFLAVPRFGMLGAAWATAAAYATMAVCLLVLIQRHYPVPYAWGRVLTLVGLACLALFAWTSNAGLRVWWWELLMLTVYSLAAVATLRSSLRGVRDTS